MWDYTGMYSGVLEVQTEATMFFSKLGRLSGLLGGVFIVSWDAVIIAMVACQFHGIIPSSPQNSYLP